MAKIEVGAGATKSTIEITPGERLLHHALAHPARPVPFGCRKGVCGTCLSQVLEGWDSFAPASPAEQELLDALGVTEDMHMRLACQLVVRDDAQLLPVGKKGARSAVSRPATAASQAPDQTTHQTSSQKG
ncbi:2Fe-2S iron-sulfur cluster-binding protein [Cystobacter fuscus]|uniref:2Fe-2S iron-sulfur cluster-binding protein n=1 Tax=Cystobacter fuscus TaxID=43 RepID=UPI0037BEBAD4